VVVVVKLWPEELDDHHNHPLDTITASGLASFSGFVSWRGRERSFYALIIGLGLARPWR
jgi:hypothetical protein